MKGLKLANDLTLPLDAVTQTFLVVGKRGSGKSNTAARFVEQLHHARLPFVVLDPVDTWWGLKAGIDGGRGLDVYVFGGRKQDLPLNAPDGGLIAEVLCEHRVSMVLSVKHLSGRERSAFMVAFAQTLFRKWGGGPLHVVLEEAHELAPQMQGSRSDKNTDNEAAMLGAFKRLWKLGRSAGIGGTAVTQRPASLSKDITTQSEILIAHRTIGPQDVKAIGEWVKYHGEHLDILAKLPSLPTGEAFVWAPEFPEGNPIGLTRTTVLLRETYDSASTPKVGEQRIEPKELAAVDLERLRSKMSATIERAKADDPKELRKQLVEKDRRIRELERATPAPQPAASKTVDVEILTEQDRELLADLRNDFATFSAEIGARADARLGSMVDRAKAAIDEAAERWTTELEKRRSLFLKWLGETRVQRILDKLDRVSAPPPVRPAVRGLTQGKTEPVAGFTGPAREPRRSPAAGSDDSLKLKKGARDIIGALARRHPQPMAWSTLALLCGIKATGSTMSTYMSNLRKAGLIVEHAGDLVSLTDEGLDAAGGARTMTPEELLALWSKRLKRGARAILDSLVQAFPQTKTKDELAEVLGVGAGGSTLSSYLSNLRTAGLIQEGSDGIKASEELFG